jgi:hypothetical protein
LAYTSAGIYTSLSRLGLATHAALSEWHPNRTSLGTRRSAICVSSPLRCPYLTLVDHILYVKTRFIPPTQFVPSVDARASYIHHVKASGKNDASCLSADHPHSTRDQPYHPPRKRAHSARSTARSTLHPVRRQTHRRARWDALRRRLRRAGLSRAGMIVGGNLSWHRLVSRHCYRTKTMPDSAMSTTSRPTPTVRRPAQAARQHRPRAGPRVFRARRRARPQQAQLS